MPDLALVKAWLEIEESTWDTELEALLARTIDAVQIELDWYFGSPRAVTEILNGTGTNRMFLRQPPANGLTLSYRAGVGYDWEAVDTDDFENVGRGLYHTSTWTRGARNYRAEYSEGFAAWPGDVEQVVLDLITSLWNGRKNDPGMKSETIGDYSYTRGDFEAVAGWARVKAHWKRGRI